MDSGPERIEDSYILHAIVKALASIEEVGYVVAPVELSSVSLDVEPWDCFESLRLVSELFLVEASNGQSRLSSIIVHIDSDLSSCDLTCLFHVER